MYAAQIRPQIDAAMAENNRFRTETTYAHLLSLIAGFPYGRFIDR